jgi:hypothetical protein
MTTRQFSTVSFIFVAGCVAGLLLFKPLGSLSGLLTPADNGHQAPKTASPELSTLQAEVERLKTIVPDQSHAMRDVDYHFTNLWFAGKAENWPLAEFYWKETLSHIKWAVRIIPVRKDNAGREVKLEKILQAIETTPTMQMGTVIQEQSSPKFEPTYRAILEGCYLCHTAADKSYLRTRIPELPATSIVNFDPKATWPP